MQFNKAIIIILFDQNNSTSLKHNLERKTTWKLRSNSLFEIKIEKVDSEPKSTQGFEIW
jgi:hypothetical protein